MKGFNACLSDRTAFYWVLKRCSSPRRELLSVFLRHIKWAKIDSWCLCHVIRRSTCVKKLHHWREIVFDLPDVCLFILQWRIRLAVKVTFFNIQVIWTIDLLIWFHQDFSCSESSDLLVWFSLIRVWNVDAQNLRVVCIFLFKDLTSFFWTSQFYFDMFVNFVGHFAFCSWFWLWSVLLQWNKLLHLRLEVLYFFKKLRVHLLWVSTFLIQFTILLLNHTQSFVQLRVFINKFSNSMLLRINNFS